MWARVSWINAFARWKAQEDNGVEWLVNYLRSNEQTEAMAKGTAFHKFLEKAQVGADISQVDQDGYTFAFTVDCDLYLPPIRERRREKDYGGIVVSGQADAVLGKTIWDHKTTERFDAENYLSSWQHRFYMDMFNADRFVWNVWEMSEIEPKSYEVFGLHQLEQYRYPEMESECRDLAHEYAEFAQKWVPDLKPL